VEVTDFSSIASENVIKNVEVTATEVPEGAIAFPLESLRPETVGAVAAVDPLLQPEPPPRKRP